MHLFNKLKLISILDKKVSLKEIDGYRVTESFVHLNRKRKKYKIERDSVSDEELIRVLYRTIPKNLQHHFKTEIRNVKIRKVIG